MLRKQRDQFLPLKVIRDRLAAAGNGVPPDDEPVANGEPGWHADPEPAEASVPLREEAHAVVGAGRVRNGAAEAVEVAAWPARARGDDPGDPDDPYDDADADAAADDDEKLEGVRPASAMAVAPRVAPPGAGLRGTSRPAAEVATVGTGVPERRAGMAAASSSTPSDRPHPERSAAPRAEPAGAAVTAGAAGSGGLTGGVAAGVLSPSVSGVSLTLAELCAATGLTPDVVASLQGLGILAPMSIAGGTFYDEEALTVGKLVVEFGRYGVEPRHLRMYRNAADREVGLVEQVITPLLRQRNPEARQRAVDAAADLARLGQSMRASLVRSELRRQLGV